MLPAHLAGLERSSGAKYILEHEFVSDGDAGNVLRAVCLNDFLDHISLAFVSTVVTLNDVVADEDFHVDLGLLDSFQLKQKKLIKHFHYDGKRMRTELFGGGKK